jgi:hypothetical protein
MVENLNTHENGNCANRVLAAGLFISKDENGNDCKIGDKVIISEPPCKIYHRELNAYTETERKNYEGVLMLSIENGYYLKGEGIHFQPPKHGTPSNFGGKELWLWRLL